MRKRLHPRESIDVAARVLALSALWLMLGTAQAALGQATRPAAPYVDSKTIKERFAEVTAEDMEQLRGKKILFASRSFGLNLHNGLRSLAAKDKRYDLLSSYARYDVFKAGGDLSIIPAEAFAKANFVHFLATYWPHTKRMEEIEQLLRKAPHEFGKTVDIVIVYFHTALPANFDSYCAKMDAMQRDFPNARFIYVTAGFMAETKAKENAAAHEWSELVRKRYKGKAPLYDLGAILSDDFRAGKAYCPEYSTDPAGVHPNTDAGQTMMAKGFLLLLRDTLHWKPGPAAAGQPGATATPNTGGAAAETLPATHPDYRAVRAILDANGLREKKVEGVSVVENGRIVRLYLQEGGISELPDAIGQLTELRVLHVYGDRSLAHPLLARISPTIARCTKLEELLINNNDLTALPSQMSVLKLKTLSLADNRLGELPADVRAWGQRLDPEGMKNQRR